MRCEVSITEISRKLSDYVNRVAYRGEHFILLRGKKAMAELAPVPHGHRLKDLPDILKSLPRLSKKEALDFESDLTRARKQLSKRKIKDPWDY